MTSNDNQQQHIGGKTNAERDQNEGSMNNGTIGGSIGEVNNSDANKEEKSTPDSAATSPGNGAHTPPEEADITEAKE